MAGYAGIVESGTGKRNPFYMDMTVWEWFGRRSFRHPDYRGLVAGGRTTTLILPARNVAATIGPILDSVAGLRARTGLPGQVVVVDADSPDGTADIARAHGATGFIEVEFGASARQTDTALRHHPSGEAARLVEARAP